MPKKRPEPINMLQELHQHFINLPLQFRQEVCTECNWSIPTFYRKQRFSHDKEGKSLFAPLSNAEKEGIIRMADLVFNDLKVFLDKFKQKPE